MVSADAAEKTMQPVVTTDVADVVSDNSASRWPAARAVFAERSPIVHTIAVTPGIGLLSR
jgi:hypothetical protein